MRKLVVFDVDGTLIDTLIGSFKEIGVLLGKEKEVREHDEEYQRRKHLGPWGLEELALIFKGIPEEEIKKAAREVIRERLMPGTRETINQLKQKGYVLASYSSSPAWIVEELKDVFGFDDILGNVFEIKEGKITGKLLEKVDRYAKAERLKNFQAREGITRENTYIVGDSVTDLPMAEYGRFVAFNADKQEVKDKAEFVINKKDLREILSFIN